jgi:hypothetical protein
MPQHGLILRALIAAPFDVQEERHALSDVIWKWNNTYSWDRGAAIEPVPWEPSSVPGLTGRPPDLTDQSLVEVCDFLIGVFWTRLGTSEELAESGTAAQIEEFRRAGKPVLLFFSTRPFWLPSVVDPSPYKQLVKLRAWMEKVGSIETYQDVEEFRTKLFGALTQTVDDVLRMSGLQASKEAMPSKLKTAAPV